jgi:uncharacterized protein (DUF1697 family)
MRQIVLLRGINLGSRNRVAMPALRELLSESGFDDVRTYLQSGNVVLASDLSPERLAAACETKITREFGLDVGVVVRTRDELAEIVARNPLAEIAHDPKRYQVTFLARELDPQTVEKLASLASASERLVALDRELYAWHPDGIARSRLSLGLVERGLRVATTSRNWTTVTTLLEMAEA